MTTEELLEKLNFIQKMKCETQISIEKLSFFFASLINLFKNYIESVSSLITSTRFILQIFLPPK